MLTSDLTITDYAQRRRVLGRRADMRLSRALRHSDPLHRRLRLGLRNLARRGWHARDRLIRPHLIRPHLIRQWHDGSFVVKVITPPAAA